MTGNNETTNFDKGGSYCKGTVPGKDQRLASKVNTQLPFNREVKIALHTFFLEMFNLLPIISAIFSLLVCLESIAVKQSRAY